MINNVQPNNAYMDPVYTNEQGVYSGVVKLFSGLRYQTDIDILHKGVYNTLEKKKLSPPYI